MEPTPSEMDDVIADLDPGRAYRVTVEARDGDLREDQTWSEHVRYLGEQSSHKFKGRSRKESHEFERVSDGQKAYLRFPKDHRNNFGFLLSQRDTSVITFDALWQDPFRDDRRWYAVEITPLDD